MSQQFQMQPWLIFVRFEQGRGKGGVPKTWIAYQTAGDKKPAVKTLVRQAVQMFRASSSDPHMGHSKDLMPGRDREYQLHNVDGGRVEKVDDIKWETVQVGMPAQAQQRAELILTWRLPSEVLLEQVRMRK